MSLIDFCPFPHPRGPCLKCKDNQYKRDLGRLIPRINSEEILIELHFFDIFSAADWRPDATYARHNYYNIGSLFYLRGSDLDKYQEAQRLRQNNVEFQIITHEKGSNYCLTNVKRIINNNSLESDFISRLHELWLLLKNHGAPEFYKFDHGYIILYYKFPISFSDITWTSSINYFPDHKCIFHSEKRAFRSFNNIRFEAEMIRATKTIFKELEFPSVLPLFQIVSYFIRDNKIPTDDLPPGLGCKLLSDPAFAGSM